MTRGRAEHRPGGGSVFGPSQIGINIQSPLYHLSLANSSSLQTTIRDEICCKYPTHSHTNTTVIPVIHTKKYSKYIPLSHASYFQAVAALCLFAAVAADAEAKPEAEADAYYGHHYGYGLAHHG